MKAKKIADRQSHALTTYKPLEARIQKGDLDALLARWEFGRKLLEERDGRERLPKGRLRDIANALAVSEAELKNRVQFAEQYSTESKVCAAFKEHGSWSAICASGMGQRSGSAARGDEAFADVADLKPHRATSRSTLPIRSSTSSRWSTTSTSIVPS